MARAHLKRQGRWRLVSHRGSAVPLSQDSKKEP
jgi:hypothetical protein